MTARSKTNLKIVGPDLDQMEATISEFAAQTGPMTSRAASLANRQTVEVAVLRRERADFEDRLSLLKAQYEAAERALLAHVTDIDATLALYPQQAD